MRTRLLLLAMLAALAFLTGCQWLFGPQPGPPGFGGAPTIETPADARDAAIEYVNRTDPEANIPTGVAWTEENITPIGLVGVAIYRYTVADPSTMEWEIIVRYVVVPQPDYRVEINNIERGGYWQVLVRSTGEVEPIPLITLKGPVVVTAEGTRSESWGVHVLAGPSEYIGAEIGLRSYTEMKPQLEGLLGERIKVMVSKVCRSFDEAERCCASAFELCAPIVLELMPDIED